MEELRWEVVSYPLSGGLIAAALNAKQWLTYARNRGELAEGWYDPTTLQKARTAASDSADTKAIRRLSEPNAEDGSDTRDGEEESSDEDLVGPALPGQSRSSRNLKRRAGPAGLSIEDLDLRRGDPEHPTLHRLKFANRVLEREEEGRMIEREELRLARKLDRKSQRERLEELVPRAEAGSKERMLEKKREKAGSHRSFAAGKADVSEVAEVGEAELYGADDGGIEGFKKRKKEVERRKNERELRKEEMLRARREEHEARVQDYRAREEKTMSGLVALARARFG